MDTLSILKRMVEKHGAPVTASLIGVPYPTVWRWLNGKHKISPAMTRLIAMAGDADEQDLESASKS